MWQSLSDRVALKANTRVWTKQTDRALFRFDFAPATEGELAISQGDGSLTIGQPIVIGADSSPIVIALPLPILIPTDKRRLSLRASRALKVSLSVLEVEPTEVMNTNGNYSSICNSLTIESTTQSTTLLEYNPNRKFASITNNSESVLCVDYLDNASITNHAVKINPYGYFEVPIGIQTKIVGIWQSISGSAFVREFV